VEHLLLGSTPNGHPKWARSASGNTLVLQTSIASSILAASTNFWLCNTGGQCAGLKSQKTSFNSKRSHHPGLV
jgi:hypothetical protein